MSDSYFHRALARRVSRSLGNCELVHLPRQECNLQLATLQHENYVRALESAGVEVTVLQEEPDLPDSHFVEDPVVILDELAVIGRPASASRRPEADKMAGAVSEWRPLHRIKPPGHLEGGDVLRAGKRLFVGRSTRTDLDGIRQLSDIVRPFGYQVTLVEVTGCLHLKTGITSPRESLFIANPAWIDLSPFRNVEIVPVTPDEPWGANVLAVNGRVLVAASAPQTARLLQSKELNVHAVDLSEFQKAEAGLTCLSALFSTAIGSIA